jgi:4a-hydroxytetrahydrobiopterin dehydratase
MEELKNKRCEPCEGGIAPLKREEFSVYLDQVSNWDFVDNDTKMEREIEFKDFKSAIDFINRVSDVAEEEGHHPNIYLHSWNKVKITLYTHAISGLSINDFVCAVKFDTLIED